MRQTVDGFPIQQSFSWLPDEPDPEINRWSYGKTVKIEVWYVDWYYNLIHGKYQRTITWKGQTDTVIDYEWFQMIIKGWMENKFYPMTKEQALDEWFFLKEFVASE